MRKKTKKTKDNICNVVSVSDFLKYIENEVVVLQKQQYEGLENQPEEEPKKNTNGVDALGSVMIESFLFEAILGDLFGGNMVTGMFSMLAGDDFEMFFGGIFLLLDNDAQSQRLQAPFILSVYPKGRRSIKTIMENMKSGRMRGSASRSFMTRNEREQQLVILTGAEEQLKQMYKNCVYNIFLDPRQTIQNSINSSFYNMGKQTAQA